jgi:carboxymethylenebutenolidase
MSANVSFPSNGDQCPGYLAVPASGSGPAVVLIQEWWGLVPHIVDVADRLAAEGFVTLAPDLYRGETTTEPDDAQKKMMSLNYDQAARDIAGAASYLCELDSTTGDSVGTVGFCMGGSLAIWAGSLSVEITAMVGFYPALSWDDLAPDWSRYAGKSVVMHLDEHEGGASAAEVQRVHARLTASGAETVLYDDYPGTDHAFFNDDRPEVHDPDASRVAWQRTVEFLHEQLG